MKSIFLKPVWLSLALLAPGLSMAVEPATSAQPASSSSQPPTGGKGGPVRNPAIEQALRACKANLEGGQGGRVDPARMEACMTAKGFKRPPGPPPRGQGGPPPADASRSE